MVAHHVIVFLADTAFIASRGGWLYCDDSRVTSANAKDVVVSFLSLVLLSAATNTEMRHYLPAGQACIRPVLQTC